MHYENAVLTNYETLYGYVLDDTLYLGLASSHNQIANAFSTQIPLNMQMNYIGGSLMPDYFAATSWLKTILIHETAHNFQLNAKRNPLSSFVHKIVKNTPVTWLYFAPVFPLPNLLESSFILEGNAVLNESIFGNGGRLYSGAMKALTLTQAQAGLITPERCYNDHLFFPYGTHHYIVGGFFQLFLAQKYGVEKTDRYFLAYSDQWLPFFTNAVFKAHFGKNFETLLQEYNQWLSKEVQEFHVSEGEEVAFSKYNGALNRDKDEVYFLISDAHSAPKLVRVNKKNKATTIQPTEHLFGQLFKIKGKYYSQTSASVKNNRIAIALFDAHGKMLKNSDSKVLQSRLPDGSEFYFNVKNSYDQLHLYKNGQEVALVNSSVICDRDGNYYYFRQKGKERILYKNQTPLFSYQGYYGKVVDIDKEGRVLFIANSSSGSALYRFNGFKTERITSGDDIIDAKLLSDTEVLVSVIRAEGIAYLITALNPEKSSVYENSYFFEKKYALDLHTKIDTSETVPYRPLTNMHYSALSQSVEATDDGVNFNISAAFSDPLEQNHFCIYTAKYDDETIAGAGYDNSSYAVNFGLDLYGVLSHEEHIDDRGMGINAYMAYPWFKQSYRSADVSLQWHLDSDRDAKSPLSLNLKWQDKKHFGFSMYPNALQEVSLFAVQDRSDSAYGAAYNFMKDLGAAFYFGAGVHYAQSERDGMIKEERGILIDDTSFSGFYDPSRFVMPSLTRDIYVRKALQTELSLAKVFDFHKYYFSLPLSLRRESVYGKYRYFHFEDRREGFNLNEYTLGLKVELLLFHKVIMPISFEFLKNDDLKESNNFRVLFDLNF